MFKIKSRKLAIVGIAVVVLIGSYISNTGKSIASSPRDGNTDIPMDANIEYKAFESRTLESIKNNEVVGHIEDGQLGYRIYFENNKQLPLTKEQISSNREIIIKYE